MKICIGSDHGGFELKEHIKSYLTQKGYEVLDVGCDSKESVDYPVFAKEAAKLVGSGKYPRGILICTTGIGMSMVANKFENVRTALCHNTDSAEMSRAHNDANILALGAKYVPCELADKMLDIWLSREFEGGRHQRRVSQISNKSC
ncbi:ribose 5-phosphate isomerase B [bacterium]|nr:ribose 5-phosphate isomerase B [bacterium]